MDYHFCATTGTGGVKGDVTADVTASNNDISVTAPLPKILECPVSGLHVCVCVYVCVCVRVCVYEWVGWWVSGWAVRCTNTRTHIRARTYTSPHLPIKTHTNKQVRDHLVTLTKTLPPR